MSVGGVDLWCLEKGGEGGFGRYILHGVSECGFVMLCPFFLGTRSGDVRCICVDGMMISMSICLSAFVGGSGSGSFGLARKRERGVRGRQVGSV